MGDGSQFCRLVSVARAAEIAGVSSAKLRRLIASGVIKTRRVGMRRMVVAASLEQCVDPKHLGR